MLFNFGTKKNMPMSEDLLNQVDLCLVVDTTGSMGSFLDAARQHLRATIESLCAANQVNARVGLVEYRDHPPQERSFVTKVYPMTADRAHTQKVIAKLLASGGGDSPEAVYDGVRDGCTKMEWRPHSLRFLLLVGDAPPHGTQAHLGIGNACPCGLTLHDVTATAEQHGVAIHALCMTGGATQEAFQAMAQGTGGTCVLAGNANAVIEVMTSVLDREFRALPFDREVLAAAQSIGEPDTQKIADQLNQPRGPVAASLARLSRRNLLDSLMAVPVSL